MKDLCKLLLISVTVLSLTVLNSSSVYAFKVLVCVVDSCTGAPIHEDITANGLGFIKSNVFNDIVDEHAFVDLSHALESKWHFDGCEFREATENINELYARAVNALDPDHPDLEDAPDAFGQLLHPIQDFYAHSNWVELSKAELVDGGLSWWSVLQPYTNVQGVLVIQGEENTIPAGYVLRRSGKVATVSTPNGTFPGLLTGTYGADDCPDNIAIEHSDLNKDEPGAGGLPLLHPTARALATKQTMHEWCRLVNLVRQTYGERGAQFLFDNWVADRQRAETVCANLDSAFVIYVDQASINEFELGTKAQPFRSLVDAINVVPNRSVVEIVQGQYFVNNVLTKPMTLTAKRGTVILSQ